MTPTSDAAIRKVAILVDSLDRHSAEALLQSLGESEAERVRWAMARLVEVEERERRQVLDEFARSSGRAGGLATNDAARSPRSRWEHDIERAVSTRGGVEVEFSSAARGVDEPLDAPREEAPFQAIADAPLDLLSSLLAQEQPQVAALVLAHLPRLRAASILEQWPASRQVEVARRIASLQATDPLVLSDVGGQLAALVREAVEQRRRRVSGGRVLEEILAVASESARDEVTRRLNLSPAPRAGDAPQNNELERSPPRPHASVSEPLDTAGTQRGPNSEASSSSPSEARPLHVPMAAPSSPVVSAAASGPGAAESPVPMFPFEELADLTRDDLFRVLDAAPEATVLALAGAPMRVVDRVLRELPARQAKHMRQRMEGLHGVRLRDVEQAQAELGRIAAELLARGEISLSRNARFAAAA